ncbi:NAD(P)-binding domain-containing protein [Shivajiella indica]|uniref:NAD(P)-binding domain-containing protein n=1 Tax=Shivajiella indica TaxID=872115 RepID=A0ABW5B6G1_9BACT
MTRVSIIGLGWLGRPLAIKFQELGYSVKGSSTTAEKVELLNKKGISAKLLNFEPHPVGDRFHELFDTDILFINIPPKTRSSPPTFYPEQMKFLKEIVIQKGIKKVIYVSSTSVYPDQNQIAREEDEISMENTGHKSLLKAEHLFGKERSYDLSIIRFGGLLGFDRIPGKYFSGKEGVIGDTPVNYIHQVDAVNLVIWIIENGLWNQIFNGVAPFHPKRREIYERNALDLGFPPPKSYENEGSGWKEISAAKILNTGFKFKFPNPLEFTYDKV